jgi:hypothetical protein
MGEIGKCIDSIAKPSHCPRAVLSDVYSCFVALRAFVRSGCDAGAVPQNKLAQRYGYSPLHPHHVNYFTPATLRALVERAGFEVVRMTATFPMEWLALHGLNYVKHPKLGRVAHWLRMGIEASALSFAPDRWERLRDGWAARGWGREVELWARKA